MHVIGFAGKGDPGKCIVDFSLKDKFCSLHEIAVRAKHLLVNALTLHLGSAQERVMS